MEKMILKDGSEIQIHEGADLSNIVTDIKSCADLEQLAQKLKTENLTSVQFVQESGLITAEYNNLELIRPHLRVNLGDTVSVTFGLKLRTPQDMQQEDVYIAIAYLSDEQALTVSALYPTYESVKGKEVDAGFRLRHNGKLYKTKKGGIIPTQYAPGGPGTESIYTLIDDTYVGTLDDPIPAERNMEYVKGLYYSDGGTIYLMDREGMEEGESIVLQYLPSELVGQYFTKVE